MTFFSKAARIWIQGLSAVAGEVANPIEANPCLRRLCTAGSVHPRALGNNFPGGVKPSLCARLPFNDCLLAAGLPLKKPFGAVDEIRPVGRWETFLNGPDSSTFGGDCNNAFT
jgi:hypothetical protein